MNSIKNGEVLLPAKLPSVFEKLNLREIYISKLILHLNLIQCFILLFDLFYDETVKQKSEAPSMEHSALARTTCEIFW